jgi:hypothetical protein
LFLLHGQHQQDQQTVKSPTALVTHLPVDLRFLAAQQMSHSSFHKPPTQRDHQSTIRLQRQEPGYCNRLCHQFQDLHGQTQKCELFPDSIPIQPEDRTADQRLSLREKKLLHWIQYSQSVDIETDFGDSSSTALEDSWFPAYDR